MQWYSIVLLVKAMTFGCHCNLSCWLWKQMLNVNISMQWYSIDRVWQSKLLEFVDASPWLQDGIVIDKANFYILVKTPPLGCGMESCVTKQTIWSRWFVEAKRLIVCVIYRSDWVDSHSVWCGCHVCVRNRHLLFAQFFWTATRLSTVASILFSLNWSIGVMTDRHD